MYPPAHIPADISQADLDMADRHAMMREVAPRSKGTLEAHIAVLRTAVAGLLDDLEDCRTLEPTCNECTDGSTPINLDKGLCHWHEALRAMRVTA